MRKLAIFSFLSVLFIMSSCDVDHDKASMDSTKLDLIKQFKLMSDENSLGWNVDYRKALILNDRPMGYVFSYSLAFKEFNEESKKTILFLQIDAIIPMEFIENKEIKILLDKKDISITDIKTNIKNGDKLVGSDISLLFEVNMNDLLNASDVFFKLDSKTDLLISDKKCLNKFLIDWHESIIKNSQKQGGVMMRKIKF